MPSIAQAAPPDDAQLPWPPLRGPSKATLSSRQETTVRSVSLPRVAPLNRVSQANERQRHRSTSRANFRRAVQGKSTVKTGAHQQSVCAWCGGENRRAGELGRTLEMLLFVAGRNSDIS